MTLFNIAAQDFVAPELIQGDCNGEVLAHEVALRLDDAGLRARQVARQSEALVEMGRGGPDPNEAAASAILNCSPLGGIRAKPWPSRREEVLRAAAAGVARNVSGPR